MRFLSAIVAAVLANIAIADTGIKDPPKGFTALFNGKNLDGWHGMPDFNPYDLDKMAEADRKAQVEKWTADAVKHWKVENGELVNDGHGAYMTTDKEYGDIELL